jgi:nitrogen regulatory protein P-II 1
MDDRTMRMVVLVVRSAESFDPLINALLDAGMTGATVVDSRGLAAVLRQEMPIFAGLAALLPQATGSRMIVSIATKESVDTLMRFVDEMPSDVRPVGAVIPIERTIGLS